MEDSMEMETTYILPSEESIRVIGNRVRSKVLDNQLLKINMGTLVTGTKTKKKGEDVIFTQMDKDMKEIG